MLSRGNDLEGKRYFDGYRDEISGSELPKIQRALEQGTTDGAARRAVNDVWKQLGPKARNDPVKIATMEQALRDGLGDDTKVIRAAVASTEYEKPGRVKNPSRLFRLRHR